MDPSLVPGYAALLGDLAASRRHPDRDALQREVASALKATEAEVASIVGLSTTIGDEIQGLYGRAGDALEAALRVRARLAGTSEVRFSIGWGVLTVFDPDTAPFGQDGPAWWAARDALEELDRDGRESTVVRMGDRVDNWRRPNGLPEPGTLPELAVPLLNAFLACRDALFDRMDARDARLLIALLRGEKQADVAAAEGISQAAISQRLARNGSYVLRRAEQWLAEAGL